MICSSMEKDWLFWSSSQAAVTDTTSGLMLFSCSSNCSLNRMAWSLGISRFTPDIWRQEKRWESLPFFFLVHLVPYRLCAVSEWRGLDLLCTHFINALIYTRHSGFNNVRTLCQIHGNSLSIFMPHWLLWRFSLLCLWISTFTSAENGVALIF